MSFACEEDISGDSDRGCHGDEARRLTLSAQRFPEEPEVLAANVYVVVHAIPVDQIENTQAPMPVVVDHATEAEPAENLISLFPGRASLWPQLAEKTSQIVRAKLQCEASQIATPPWGVVSGASVSSAGTR